MSTPCDAHEAFVPKLLHVEAVGLFARACRLNEQIELALFERERRLRHHGARKDVDPGGDLRGTLEEARDQEVLDVVARPDAKRALDNRQIQQERPSEAA